jgi:hypothetical protein
VLGDGPLSYWRLCEWGVSSAATYLDSSGNARPLQGSPFAGSTTTASPKSPGQPLLNETNAYEDFDRSYIRAPSTTGAYAPLSQMSARGPFSVEAWVRSKQSYTECQTCGFVVPAARSAGSWQLGWAGTAPARGRDPLWVHDGIPGPPIGANGWTFTIYAGYHKHCTGCADDTTHYLTAHRLQTTAPIEAGRWYHLAATYDGLTMRLYVDGNLAGELGVGAIADVRSAPSGTFDFGVAADEEHSSNTGANSNNQVQLQGAIDEGAYYGRALSAGEVANHYDAASTQPLSPQAGVSSAYRSGVANDNPYLWFPLDEHYTELTTRTTCYPCASYERTSAANAGSVGAPVRDITGPAFPLGAKDRGLEFRDGARIATTQGPKYPLPSSTTNMSVETWIQTAPSTPEKQAFYATPICSSCSGMVALRLNGGSLELRADSDGFTFNTWQSLGGQGLNDGRWHHLLVVRDLTGEAKWRAYVDGKPTGVTRPTSTQSLLRGPYLGLGDMNAWVGITGNGRIALDEFAYYTRALSGSRADYDFLIQQHAPVLRYDGDEDFRVISPAAITDFYDETSLLQDDSNSIHDTASFGIADGRYVNQPPGYMSELNLGFLGSTYSDSPVTNGRREGTASTTQDFLSARGGADDFGLYQGDATTMLSRGYGNRVYARAALGSDGRLWIQYWFFYYFNPRWVGAPRGEHEGDWEMVQVGVNSNLDADHAAYAQHGDGQQCDWNLVETSGSQPVVYVARHSHASYFGSERIPEDKFFDRANGAMATATPGAEDITATPPSWVGWQGVWGDSDNSPPGPINQPDDKWDDPGLWASRLDVC